jgi:ATP-dependent RNA circularization protein (DNA/RNA ligase family)
MTISVVYPKIETLYNRSPETFVVDPDELRLPEFDMIKGWVVTEKVDGTNVRVACHSDGDIEFGGRTDNAQMPIFLLNHLREVFIVDKFVSAFEGADLPEIILFGEGYGPKIQKGGGLYRSDVSFRLFDVKVGDWWLNFMDVEGVAQKMGITTVPRLAYIDYLPKNIDDLAIIVDQSVVSREDRGAGCRAEGIVAHTEPMLFTRRGQRMMWKLKFKDFESRNR